MQFGQLHIGASDTICRYFLVPYLEKFHKKYPDVPIKITNATSYGCVDLLEHGNVDLPVAGDGDVRDRSAQVVVLVVVEYRLEVGQLVFAHEFPGAPV